MKKSLFFLCSFVLLLCFQSCETCDETCGIIIDDPIITDADGNLNYGLTIENDCSGNEKTFYFTEDIWMNNYVDDYFCVTDVSSWKVEGNIVEVDSIRRHKNSIR